MRLERTSEGLLVKHDERWTLLIVDAVPATVVLV